MKPSSDQQNTENEDFILSNDQIVIIENYIQHLKSAHSSNTYPPTSERKIYKWIAKSGQSDYLQAIKKAKREGKLFLEDKLLSILDPDSNLKLSSTLIQYITKRIEKKPKTSKESNIHQTTLFEFVDPEPLDEDE